MEVRDTLRLVFNDQSSLSYRVLSSNAGRAAIRVADEGLHTAYSKHEPAPRVRPICSKRYQARDIEGAYHLACRPDANTVPEARPYERVAGEKQAFSNRNADMIHELKG